MSSTEISDELQPAIRQAVDVLKSGGLLAYPTEGVFGLGCDPTDLRALQRVIEIKQRDASKGLIIVAAEFSQFSDFIQPLDPIQADRVLPTWPGAVTWIVEARPALSELLTGGRKSIAIRVSQHPVVAALCSGFGGPIVSTSANFSGQPAATTAQAVTDTLGSHIDFVLDAPLGGQQGATPIFDAASGKQLR